MQKLPVNRNGQYEVKQSTAGPATRKRSRELMQGTDLLQLPSPVPQKKGSFVGQSLDLLDTQSL